MMVKNETGAGLPRDVAQILAYELLALGHVLLRERHLLAGYARAPGARSGRRPAAGSSRRGGGRSPPVTAAVRPAPAPP